MRQVTRPHNIIALETKLGMIDVPVETINIIGTVGTGLTLIRLTPKIEVGNGFTADELVVCYTIDELVSKITLFKLDTYNKMCELAAYYASLIRGDNQ